MKVVIKSSVGFLVFVACVTTFAPVAKADGADGDRKPLAEALFRDGRQLLEGGQAREACVKFAMSQRIEPKLGTLLNLASCHETIGKTASAWAEFTEAQVVAARANQDEREQFAREHADLLLKKLSRIKVNVNAGDASIPITIRLDDVILDRATRDTELPLDPGAHAIVVSADGRTSWSSTINVPDGPSLTPVDVPALETTPPTSDRGSASSSSGDASTSSRSVPTYVLLGAGVAGIATGSIFGLLAFSKQTDAKKECDGFACSQRGLDLYDQATTRAHVSTIAFGVGIVALAAGVYLFVRRGGAHR